MRSFESALVIGEREPFSATTLIIAGVLAAAGTAATVYQTQQMSKMAAQELPPVPAAVPEPRPMAPAAPTPRAMPQVAPAPGTQAASLKADAAAAAEIERARRRLSRQSTILTSPMGARLGGTFLGG